MRAISPPRLWQAEDAPVLHIEAAFKTSQKNWMATWTKYKTDSHQTSFRAEDRVGFEIVGDGKFRSYTINLAYAEGYTGALSYLMFKPIEETDKDAWVKIKRIWFGRQ
ncbi:MAG: hypothetical protein HN758_02120 [Verrucomicrobia bacterium]|jgi:hypothetical protein|nr:hypothetical protein [Verrucomicrobiota bacterium]MBT5064582.1 hypothetical protein [Verrucomicrobiota bacterium]MBT6239740.1 hypothetical protein [Verrucomicrobiota bacterium]MBT7873202.1 hypothetical protein [Verrucomicrobiota bacterium]